MLKVESTLLHSVVGHQVNASEVSGLGMEATFKDTFCSVFVFHLLVSVALGFFVGLFLSYILSSQDFWIC